MLPCWKMVVVNEGCSIQTQSVSHKLPQVIVVLLIPNNSIDSARNIQFYISLYVINGAILLFQAGKNCFVALCGGRWSNTQR